ncbi:MAG: mechanosensitive ion channel family protein [Deltaproteobacteria bacterium]|jgi:small conductance mechanosensitive channel|nr:mechanosensitive ion channel family protein [Deltaproteobacteria bacterium]MBW2511317.1 mechanosensitive ion channel family protein [Deltaproteobacteria bacterium]MDH4007118.1 mechanosensitive ion channel family protein [Desulfuromonadales bacterium]
MEIELDTIQQIYNVVFEFIINYSFQILGAIIILIVGAKLAGWLGRLVTNLCEKKNVDITLARFLGNVVKILTLTFVIIIAIGKFGISIAPFIAALGAIAFGTSFAISGPVSNYGAGLVIILSRPFVIGDTITINNVSGLVEEIHLATTILTTEDDEKITIPNKHIIGEILLNSFNNRIVESSVGISYQDDPEKAIEVIREALSRIDDICSEPPPQIGIEAFGESSIDLGIRYWVPTKKYFQTLYRGNLAVHKALKQAQITIPFPQRDVNLTRSED